MNKLIIGVDVDDVVADLITAWLARYNREFGETLTKEDITSWSITSHVKCPPAKMFSYLDPSIYDEVQPIPGALEVVKKLREFGRVVFITTGNGDAKCRWLRRHGFIGDGSLDSAFAPSVDVVATADKNLIKADFLFDDHIKNVEGFSGLGYLVPQPHNRAHDCERPRLTSFQEAPLVVEAAVTEFKVNG